MKNPNGIPDAAEYGQTIAYMVRNGMTGAEARAMIGDTPNGRSRKQITDELRAGFKESPKAQ